METQKISQKEYLKKYLSSGEKKKKIKMKKVKNQKVHIIDDDINLDNIRPMDDAEFDIINATEDAPIIVGVIDERGPVDFADRKKWKIIADDGDGNVAVKSESHTHNSYDRDDEPGSDLSPPRASRTSREEKNDHQDSRDNSDLDLSPRKSKHSRESRQTRQDSDLDSSPPRKSKRSRESKKTRHDSDSDLSPPRKSKNSRGSRHDSDLDLSPPRKSTNSRGSRHDSDLDLSPPRKSTNSRGFRHDSDLDLSPPRKSTNSRGSRHDSDLDLSPPRKSKNSRGSRHDSDQDLSLPRKSKHNSRESSKSNNGRKHSRWNDNSARSPTPEAKNGRLKKTLDGKTAGLQNAKTLQEEALAHKRREKEMFSKMSAEVSGFGQAAVMRDRKTGKRRDLVAEELERQAKEERQKELDDKYAKWGRGLKQVDDRAEKLKQDLYEMNKPFARHADDADLDAAQRAAVRDEDPMKLFSKEAKVAAKPIYQNSTMPNRFGIRPGYRWDGVDRSNGYEKKWFEAKNARIAIQEEAYKWSTADM